MESSLYGLAILGVLTSVVGAFYYLRWIKIIFFEGTASTPGAGFYHQLHLHSKNTCSAFFIDKEKSLILGMTTLFLVVFFA